MAMLSPEKAVRSGVSNERTLGAPSSGKGQQSDIARALRPRAIAAVPTYMLRRGAVGVKKFWERLSEKSPKLSRGVMGLSSGDERVDVHTEDAHVPRDAEFASLALNRRHPGTYAVIIAWNNCP